MQVRITGLEDVERRLKNAPKQLVAHAFTKALDRAIGVVEAEVHARTPEGPDQGELKSNIVTAIEIDSNYQGGAAVCGFSSRRSARTGKPMDAIASWVEFGHVQVGHGSKKSSRRAIGHVPAHPFMRPAAAAAAERAIQVFTDSLLDSLTAIEES